MRIWDIHPSKLCRNHLLGEHRELHAIWNILTKNKKGYRKHPEVKRWEGKLPALHIRHILLVLEMRARGYKHNSPLDGALVLCDPKKPSAFRQTTFVNTVEEQMEILNNKHCSCKFT